MHSKRGRPYGQMTTRRRQVLETLKDQMRKGERVSFASIARRCGLYSYNDARRIVEDLKAMGEV